MRIAPSCMLVVALFAMLGGTASGQSPAGATWTLKVNLSDSLGAQCSSLPSMAADVSGTVHVIWGECLAAEPENTPGSIYYRRSKDRAWSKPIDIITTGYNRSIESSLLQATADGRLHAVWVEPAGYNLYEIYYSWAPIAQADSAQAWARPRLVHTSTRAVDFKAGDDGSLRVVYTSDSGMGLYLATSLDLGRTWSHTKIDLLAADLVGLALGDGGALHVVWQRDENSERTTGTVYYTHSTDGGKSWSAPFTIDTKTPGDPRFTESYRPNLPSITVAGRGQVHIVWDGAPSGQRWHRWSADNGASWSNPVQIDPLLRAIAGNNALLADSAGVIHLVSPGHDWTKEGVGGVWYAWWDRRFAEYLHPERVHSQSRLHRHGLVRARIRPRDAASKSRALAEVERRSALLLRRHADGYRHRAGEIRSLGILASRPHGSGRHGARLVSGVPGAGAPGRRARAGRFHPPRGEGRARRRLVLARALQRARRLRRPEVLRVSGEPDPHRGAFSVGRRTATGRRRHARAHGAR